MDWYGKDAFKSLSLANITLGGVSIASVANVDNFTFASVITLSYDTDVN